MTHVPDAPASSNDDTVRDEPDAATVLAPGPNESVELAHDELARARNFAGVTALLPMASQIAAGLDVAHATGVVHRDLKPQNLSYAEGKAPRWNILDFGVATTEASQGTLTQTTWSALRPNGARAGARRARHASLRSVLLRERPLSRAYRRAAFLRRGRTATSRDIHGKSFDRPLDDRGEIPTSNGARDREVLIDAM